MPHASPTSDAPDPINRAEDRRAELAAELDQAADQFEAWHFERNRLVTELVAAGASYREAAVPGRLSASGVGRIVRRHREG